VDSRYERAVVAREIRYIEKLGNGSSRAVMSISLKRAYAQANRHAHKHVVGRTGIVLNAERDSHGSEGGSGGSKGSLLSRGKRDGNVGKIIGSQNDESTEGVGDFGDRGDGDHFVSACSNEGS
jgi:hypothetical protein